MTGEANTEELHDRMTKGETLSSEEQTALQIWYDEQDRAEDSLFGQGSPNSDTARLREQLNTGLSEVVQAAKEVERLTEQNEILRRENAKLREAVESRLLDKAA